MIYPKFLKKGSVIGLVAPSAGISIEPYKSRFLSAVKKFEDLGYKIKYNESVFLTKNMRSASAKKKS